ncbi:MAG TPA: hypothetical protein VFC63_26985 [Blastocatellia bacterium]|nr:hypothetical protein [Blastocatellia bacterium]
MTEESRYKSSESLPTLRLPRSRFSFVTEFRLRSDGSIERRSVHDDGREVKDVLGQWQIIEPSGIEMSRRAIPLFDEWLKSLNWTPPT